jgi:tRNA threonylcarbamoyladenosine biosynthesis protein TsaE
MEILTINSEQTKKVGEILAEEILKLPFKNEALILGLRGELGGGKTTFLQGFARGLGIKKRILSPTFLIFKKFKIPSVKRIPSKNKKDSRFHSFYHIDCYRIKKEKGILNLGFKEIISDPKNIIAVEWADKIEEIMPQNTIWIKFGFMNRNRREIVIKL